MALFEIKQDYENEKPEWKPPTFKDCAAAEIVETFFNNNEHAEWHIIDGKKALVIIETGDLREHAAHWEAGAKQNFDTGLYTAHTILYIQMKDYGPRPKVGKLLIMDGGTEQKRTFTILKCSEEQGVFRITMERTRQ